MADWAILSGRACQPADLSGDRSLVLEWDMPLAGPTVLLDWRDPGGADRALSVFVDPATGLAIRQREGARVTRHALAGPLGLPGGGVARLVLAQCGGPAPDWRLVLSTEGQVLRSTRGRGGLPLDPRVLGAMAAGEGLARHPALAWYGLAAGPDVPAPHPWIAAHVPLDTPSGPCPAGRLRPGDRVLTPAGPRAISDIAIEEVPAAGTLAPVRLRSPFFARDRDIVVAAEQPVFLQGTTVEYLLGCEAALAEAAHLTDSHAALREPLPGPARGVRLAVAGRDPAAQVVLAGGCGLALHGPVAPGARILAAYEALPLRLHLGTGLGTRAA
ncbi:MAG TPA: Hint domain-containing protein [Paracoccaceae bacterium]|nr:Hint domain-containing protein [Paracoccaceae bacterium]HMO70156.1 Hint domain-containing protein [Paracoccaceae bacterium]